MVGRDSGRSTIGLIPTAIAWLYRAVKERRSRTSARFSVRVSAMEIGVGGVGGETGEPVRDLLERFAKGSEQSPGMYLRNLPNAKESLLQNLSEVRASTVEKAALYLDAALSSRSGDSGSRQSHLLYTLHVYQYSLNNSGSAPGAGGVAGGRSRLHLLDLGSCDGGNLTLSGLGNVLIGIFNGQKHLPCRQSKLTGVLRECLGSLTCHATMVAHVSAEPQHYAETLHTLQIAARIHRMRRKRTTKPGSRGSTSSGERRRAGSGSSGSDFTSATSTDPSSSELSCSTVIYRGMGSRGASEDGSGTDGEHPPPMSSMLGSSRRRFGGSRILTNGTISPSSSRLMLNSSSSNEGLQSPRRGLTPTLPAIREFNGQYNLLPLSPPTPTGVKMPLHGQVPGYRQPAEVWIDGHRKQQWPPSAALSLSSPSQLEPLAGGEQLRQYGYMDAYKASMICNWVETQADAKFLTQFKQAADSTASSDSGSEHRLPLSTEVKADVHMPQQQMHSPEEPHQQQPQQQPQQHQSDKKRRTPPPQPPPRKLSSPPVHPPAGGLEDDKLSSIMEDQEEEGKVGLEVASEASSAEPLPEPDFDALDLCLARLPGSQLGPLRNGGCEMEHPVHNGHCDLDTVQCEHRDLDDPLLHPLRILSEENLTIVSTFVGSREDLHSNDDFPDDYDEREPSRLSFFRVPDYREARPTADNGELAAVDDVTATVAATAGGLPKDGEYFEQRLNELNQLSLRTSGSKQPTVGLREPSDSGSGQQIHQQLLQSNQNAKFQEDASHDAVAKNTVSEQLFTDPRYQLTGLSTFRSRCGSEQDKEYSQNLSQDGSGAAASCPSQPQLIGNVIANISSPMSPQFLLPPSPPQQHRTCPDGSSNPDIDDLIPLPKRSPGSGKSSQSDPEEEGDMIAKRRPEAIHSAEQSSAIDDQISSYVASKKKEVSSFSALLSRLFGTNIGGKDKKSAASGSGNKRSKSCDKELDSSAKNLSKAGHHKSAKSASASPAKARQAAARGGGQPRQREAANQHRATTPSTLSLDTEWEFQAQEQAKQSHSDCDNGNSIWQQQQPQMYNISPLAEERRKSSGYDSLESCSLDSMENWNVSSCYYDNRQLLGQQQQHYGTYAVPELWVTNSRELDEVALLRQEIDRHPDILNKNY